MSYYVEVSSSNSSFSNCCTQMTNQKEWSLCVSETNYCSIFFTWLCHNKYGMTFRAENLFSPQSYARTSSHTFCCLSTEVVLVWAAEFCRYPRQRCLSSLHYNAARWLNSTSLSRNPDLVTQDNPQRFQWAVFNVGTISSSVVQRAWTHRRQIHGRDIAGRQLLTASSSAEFLASLITCLLPVSTTCSFSEVLAQLYRLWMT